MGDMNVEPFAREIQRGLRACRHYSTTSRGRIFNATWPWLSEPDHHAATTRHAYRVPRPRTTIATGTPRILDQIFVSRAVLQGRPFRLDQEALRFHVDNLTSEWMRTGNVIPRITTSDHFPIAAELTW
jgi:endonuclease/exonuclease/phosphatase family metal-dependent hydrolase